MPRTKAEILSDDEWEASGIRGELLRPFRAVAVSYDRSNDTFEVDLRNGASAICPRSTVGYACDLTVEEVSEFELLPGNEAILFRCTDESISIIGMIRDSFGVNMLNRVAGMTKSELRAAASRANGKKGGRPKKKTAAHAATGRTQRGS